jgi:hypothetical protein
MISELILYGGVIYWLLLFLGISITTLFALRENDAVRPTIWASLTLIYAVGFTSYHPSTLSFFMGLLAYFMMGAAYSTYRWARVVYNIKRFVKSFGTEDCGLIAKAFTPNDANGCVNLPPEPFQFRTKLTVWTMFWPCFTIFWFVERPFKIVSQYVWKRLTQMSKDIYDR